MEEQKGPDPRERNRLLGSCPECGKNIWSNDYVPSLTEAVYRCMECRRLLHMDEIVPF